MGAILGIFCIIGVSQRIPPSIENDAMYLAAAWYNRVIMGIIIGLAGEILILPKQSPLLNAIIRGAIIGAIVSVSFGILSQTPEYTFFGAGIMFGIINDIVTTKVAK
jgi:hypothetical protein